MMATPSRRPWLSRLMMAPTSVSTMVLSRIGLSANSSGMSVSVAPAALPMPSARWPAFRPIAMTKYQRDVVLASTIRFLTISTPWWRAVWNPNVSTCGGRSRSLSIVFGHVDDPDAARRLLLELHRRIRRVVAADGDELRNVQPQQRDDGVLEVLGLAGWDWRARCRCAIRRGSGSG